MGNTTRFRAAVIVMVLSQLTVSAVLAQEAAADRKKVRDQTPRETIESFFTALADGRADTAQSLLVSPEKMKEYCRLQARLSVAFREVADAGEAAFGPDGKVLRAGIPANAIFKRLAEVDPVIDGDNAVWPSNPKAPMKLKRIGGGWRIDMHSSFAKPEQLAMTNRVFKQIGNYVSDIAKGIRDGKFENVAEVQAEFRRQRLLMNKQYAPKRKQQ